MTCYAMMNYPMDNAHGEDRKKLCQIARDRVGYALALLKYDPERCLSEALAMATDAFGLLDAIAEEADDGDSIEGYGWESAERLAECAKAVRLLMEAETKNEFIGRWSVDELTVELFRALERKSAADLAISTGGGGNEAEEEAPAHP